LFSNDDDSISSFWYYEYLLCLALGRFNTPEDGVFEEVGELILESINESSRDRQIGELVEIDASKASLVLFDGLLKANPKRTHNECSLLVELFTWEKLDYVDKVRKEFGIK